MLTLQWLSSILLATHVAMAVATEILVDYLTDSVGSASNCGTNSGLCNLRSAWNYCNARPDLSCSIHLADHTAHSIDVAHGQLELQSGATVEIVGNGATLTLTSARRLRAAAANTSHEESPQGYQNSFRQLLTYAESDFPFKMPPLSNTYNAISQYHTACVTACRFDTIIFDACDDDHEQDTFFRLFRGTAQVAFNDDTCGHAARIEYTTPPDSNCEEYCLHMGCYENVACGAMVTFSRVPYSDLSQYSTSSRLFYADNPDGAAVSSLTLRQLHIQSFGDDYMHGGAMYIAGQVRLIVDSCYFVSTTGFLGGALFITNNTEVVHITNTEFDFTHARHGGAVYIGNGVNSLTINANYFYKCTSSGEGGALLVDTDNADILVDSSTFDSCKAGGAAGGVALVSNNDFAQFINCTFYGCTASLDGGGIHIGEENDEALIEDCWIGYCTAAGGGGGGVALLQQNLGATIVGTAIEACHAQAIGGAIYAQADNTDLTIADVTATGCSSESFAAGFALMQGNARARIENTTITDCTAWWKGGGLVLLTDNVNVTLQDVAITRCKGRNGGGIFMDSGNAGFLAQNLQVTSCEASVHAGGISIGRANHQATFRDSSVTDCHAKSVGGIGGCMMIDTQNRDVLLERVQLSQCDGYLGGGMYVEANNNLTLRAVEISHCGADGSGGGIILRGACVMTTIVNSIITDNYARQDGGGIFSGSQSEELTIASTEISHNYASNGGGGIYVENGNPQFSLLDARTYENLIVLESAHPYEYTQTTHDVQVDGAEGYYVYFSKESRIATQDRVTVGGNSVYADSSTGVWPGITVPAAHVRESHFTLSFQCVQDKFNAPVTAAQGYYGYKLYVVPLFLEPRSPSVVSHNAAGTAGGGLYFFSGVNYPVMTHTQIASNFATDGGGVYLRNAVIGMLMYSSVFTDNFARLGHGGAVTVSSACQAMQIVRSNFTSNRALGGGGAIAFITNNGNSGGFLRDTVNTLRLCSFRHNNGTTNGGAVFLDLNNSLVTRDCSFFGGFTAGDGGALMMSLGNKVTLIDGTVKGNMALVCGGGIAGGRFNDFGMSSVEVTGNYAKLFGGGVCMQSESTVGYFLTKIKSNTAGVAGGGVACFGSRLPSTYLCTQSGNVAPRGSAFYFYGLSQSLSAAMTGVVISNNKAGSGTIYWVAGSMREPEGLTDGVNVYYYDNTQQNGGTIATQAVRMLHASNIMVRTYGAFLEPPIEIRLVDYYGEYVKANSPALLYVSIQSPSIEQCGGRFPFLSGADASADGVPFVDGAVTLSSIDASCSPGGQVTLLITAALDDLALDVPVERRTLVGTVDLIFRSCEAGETIVSGKCVPCPAGSYSLEANVTDDTVCAECLSLGTVDSCYADQIFLADGYWRRHTTSETILPCLDELSGCGGGNSTGDASCLVGYKGPLCTLCAEGYYRSDRKCIPCVEKNNRISPSAVVFSAIGGAGLVTAMGYLFYKVRSDREDGAMATLMIVAVNIAAWFRREARDMKVQLKILTTTFQITSTIPTATNVVFPPQFARYLSAMSVFNLNVMSAVPVDCANSGGYTFIDKLVMITLAPIGLSLLILTACFAEYTYRSLAYRRLHISAEASQEVLDEEERKLSKVVSRYLTLFFLLTYLVLPFIATTLFRTFLCTDLDPNNEDADSDDLFLTADMRITCTSDYYKRGVAYAAVMIVVYVIGIPLMYLILLYRSRKEILERFEPLALTPQEPIKQDQQRIKSGEMISEAKKLATDGVGAAPDTTGLVNQLLLRHDSAARNALMISFLYEAYEPKFWYWEVVETTRRLMLTAVLSVCGPGTSSQVLFAVLLALMYIKVYGYYAPYTKVSDDILAETGQFQIFLSFLGALVYQRHLLGNEWNAVVGAVLILINTMVLMLFVYFASTTLYNEAKTADLRKLSVRHGARDVAKPDATSVGGGSRKDPRKVYVAEDAGEAEMVVLQHDASPAEDERRVESEKENAIFEERAAVGGSGSSGEGETADELGEVVEFVDARGDQ